MAVIKYKNPNYTEGGEEPKYLSVSLVGGIGEAPSDGNQYVRQNSSWQLVELQEAGIKDAPSDNNRYVRRNEQWITLVDTIQVSDTEPVFSNVLMWIDTSETSVDDNIPEDDEIPEDTPVVPNPTPDPEPEPEPIDFMYYGYITDQINNMSEITETMLTTSTVIKTEYNLLDKHSVGILPIGSKLVVCVPANKLVTVMKDNGMGTATPFNEDIMGCNGLDIVIDDVAYKLYGEFMTVSGQMYIYIK